MGLRIVDKKFASAIAIAGAVSLVSMPAWAAGDKQPGAAQYQTEKQPGQQRGAEFGKQPGQQMEKQPGKQQLSSDQIRQAQEKLQQEGHNPGPIDGVWGPQTQAAVKEFQQAKNIQVTGQLDQQTMKELGIEEQKAGEARDLPPQPDVGKPGQQPGAERGTQPGEKQPGQQRVQ